MRTFISFTLALFLGLPTAVFRTAVQAQTLRDLRVREQAEKPSKLAPDLEEILAQDDQQALTLGQMRQNRRAAKGQLRQEKEAASADEPMRVNGVTLPTTLTPADEKQSFIVQLNGNVPEVVLREKLALLGGKISQTPNTMGLTTIQAPRTAIRQLAAEGHIAYVSPDRMVSATQWHIGNATATNTPGISDKGDSDPNTWLVGSGVGIAVIDSGVDAGHQAMAWATQSKVIRSVDFTGQNINGDPYGHGSHVASLAAGENIGTIGYKSIAPGAWVVSLRVLNSNGQGTTSSVISAIDWVIANKNALGTPIRIINLSLGTIAKDSYKTDPLCLAARRAVNAGLVVVASAGNNGKDSSGKKIYGAINSPGNDPSVITVGAANTYGTDYRGDDTIATFSSRGPTRSYTVVSGKRKYDNLIKPDLVAPGNKLIAARSSYNGQENKLAKDNPGLKTGSQTNNAEKVMYMSGTSMAAPIVASAAALLLETNPNLTPNLVKAILMYTAQPLKGFNMLEQGAGLLNVNGAVTLARLVKTTLPTTNGAALLKASLPASQTSSIWGETVPWSQGVITNYGFLSGSNLMKYWQSVYASGQVLGDATTYANGVLSLVSGKTFNATLKAGAYKINSNGLILGDSANTLFASGQVLGDGVVLGDGTILGDGIILGDGTILGDKSTRADTSLKSDSVTLGDNTACMPPAP